MKRHLRLASLLAAFILVVPLGQQGAAGDPTHPGPAVRPNSQAKSRFVQDPAAAARKMAMAQELAHRGAPRIDPLDTSVTGLIIEPEGGSDHDDNSSVYTDTHYWNFCTAGAVAATLYYWHSTNITGWSAGNFTEPSYVGTTYQRTTYWASSDTDANSPYYSTKGRAYLMYIAEQTNPPSYSNPGEISFSGWSASGTLNDMRDALNWEASSYSANWSGYFYYTVTAANLSSSSLHSAVVSDTSAYHVPLIVITKASYLPNWSSTSTVIHAITIVGYDDTAGTYTYLDTCGTACGSSTNGGTHDVNQTTLYNGIQAASSSGSGMVY